MAFQLDAFQPDAFQTESAAQPPAVTYTRFGANLTDFATYWAGRPFVNLLRLNRALPTSYGTGTTTVGVLTPNDAVDTLGAKAQYVKTGKYICTWSGPLTCSLINFWNSGAGITGGTAVGSNRYEVTVTDPDLARLALRVVNSTGVSQSAPADLAVYHEEDETDYLAGKTFRAEFKQNLDWCKIIRTLDWTTTNTGGHDLGGDPTGNSTEIATAAAIPLTMADYEGVPFSEIAELAIELGADIHLTIPARADRQFMRDALQEIYDSGWTGTLIAEYGNEFWNSIAPFDWGQGWAGNVVADGLDVDGDNNRQTVYDHTGAVVSWTDTYGGIPLRVATGMAIGAQRLWYEAEQIFGRSRVIRAFGAGLNFYQILGGGMFVQAPLYGNTPIKDLVDEYHTAGYLGQRATTAMPTTGLKALCTQKAYLLPDSDWYDAFAASVPTMDTQLSAHEAWLAPIAPQCVFSNYEAGVENYELTLGFASRGHSGTIDTTNNAINFAASVADSFETGELVATAYYASPSGTVPVVKRGYYCRMVSSTRMKLYTTLADAQADTNAVTINWTNGDTVAMENASRAIAIHEKLSNFFDGEAGRDLWDYYYTELFENRRNRFMQYGAPAQRYEPGYYFASQRYESTPETPRVAWFRQKSAEAEEIHNPVTVTEAPRAGGGVVSRRPKYRYLSSFYDEEKQDIRAIVLEETPQGAVHKEILWKPDASYTDFQKEIAALQMGLADTERVYTEFRKVQRKRNQRKVLALILH